MLRFTHICESMYKSYSPACIWYLKNPHSITLSKTITNQLNCLLDPENRIIQHWLTFCSDSGILTFTFLFSLSLRVDWEEKNKSFNGTWDHIEELYKRYHKND